MKRVKKIVVLVLTVAIWIGCMQNVMAQPVSAIGSATMKNNGNGYIDIQMEPDSRRPVGKSVVFGSRSLYPDSYDSRTQTFNGNSIISPVRNQGSYSTCWAFSACSAAETSLLKKGLLENGKHLSPLQLAYFSYNTVNNPLNISLLDKTFLTKSDFLYIGGNEFLTMVALAGWTGLVEEEVLPYKNAADILSDNLSDDYAFSKDIAHLENGYWVFSNDFDGVKSMIMNYGSGSMSYNAEHNSYFYDYYNPETAGYYYYEEDSFDPESQNFHTNHQVTVVGWDDNYSKSNFSVEPPKDGAWLIKNSWGTDFGQGGYFWLSYYDKSIYAEEEGYSYGSEVYFFDFETVENYDNNYYYDGSGGIDWLYFWDDVTLEPFNQMTMANVFTAQYEETIEAASFFTFQDNLAYTIEVYTDIPLNGAPVDGICRSSISGKTRYRGYHTVDLEEAVPVNPKDRFAIVISLDTEIAGQSVFLPIERDSQWDWGVTFDVNAREGESYLCQPGYDWEKNIFRGEPLNFRIKAFTNSVYDGALGDMNLDGKIDANDALTMLKTVAGFNELSYVAAQYGDVNTDDRIDAMDALLVLKKVANMIDDFS